MKRPDLVFRSIAERRGGWRFAGMALSPAGAVFGLAANLRRRAYSLGLGRKLRACVPVVSVGNIEVGGIGKTPVTVWLARRLVSAGCEIAVAARDLNRRSGPPLNASLGAWSSDSPPSDEVLMLAKQLPGCSVFAGPSKAQAAVRAAAEVSPDLVLVDDGFQHLTLHRDMDIVVLDFEHPLGTGGVIPAGTLREFPSALSAADCFWVNRVPAGRSPEWLTRTLSLFSTRASVVNSRPVPVALEMPGGGSVDPKGLRVVAFCGIGQPSSFRTTLAEAGCETVHFQDFPDHHVFTVAELVALEEKRKALKADLLVTTEKDAVKLGEPGIRLNICALRIELDVWGGSDRLLEDIAGLVREGGKREP